MEHCGHVRGDENPLQGSEHVTTMLGMGGVWRKDTTRGQRTPRVIDEGVSTRVGVLAVTDCDSVWIWIF